jgi:dTDP-4-amino-4,6-dideoxygalactose transaminase
MSYPVFKPFLGPDDLDACRSALDSGYLGMGSFVGDFEKALSDVLELGNERHLVTCSTGHAALHMAFMVMGIGPSDEVITPSFNNIADLQAISALGAEPVFCDVDPHTLCIDAEKIGELVTEKTKAIIAMDYGAALADLARVSEVARRYAIPMVHDAAHSFGSRHSGLPVGHQAPFTMLSFDPIKNITCIDGGALVVEDPEHVRQLREIRLIGMTQRVEASYANRRDWGYDVERLGFRYHLANLHAAIGLSQIAKFEEIKSRRRDIYTTYRENLSEQEDVQLQGDLAKDVVPFILCARVPGPRRAALKDHLKSHGIETGIHWRPGHTFSMYRDCRKGDLSVTNRIAQEIVSLPFYPDLQREDVRFICARINDFLQ